MRGLLLYVFAVSLVLPWGAARATTITATSCEQAYIRNLIQTGQAVSGDTIQLPVCTALWAESAYGSNGVGLNGIWLKGAGIDQTLIQNGVPTDGPMIVVNAGARLSHLTIEEGSGGLSGHGGRGAIQLTGTGAVSYVKCYNLTGYMVKALNAVGGVVDNCRFEGPNTTIFIENAAWGGGAVQWGDKSVADPPNLGDGQKVFIENCYFDNNATDSVNGARIVFRHNTAKAAYSHGTDSGQRERSVRSMEIYDNHFTASAGDDALGEYRGGTGVFFNNTSENIQRMRVTAYRDSTVFPPWNGADGLNYWDVNDTTVPSTTYTVLADTTENYKETTITVSGSPWTTNQWQGYNVYAVSPARYYPQSHYGNVVRNTSNTVTYNNSQASIVTARMSFLAGDTFKFTRVIRAFDSPGRGRGTLLNSSISYQDLPPPWPTTNDQVDEPIYAWNNHWIADPNTDIPLIANSPSVAELIVNNGTTPKPGYTPYTYPHPNALPVTPPADFAPIKRAEPFVNGVVSVSQALATTNGVFNGYPSPTYTYQWQSWDELPNVISDISGATSQTYSPPAALVGKRLRSRVLAANRAGTSLGTSPWTVELPPLGSSNRLSNNGFESHTGATNNSNGTDAAWQGWTRVVGPGFIETDLVDRHGGNAAWHLRNRQAAAGQFPINEVYQSFTPSTAGTTMTISFWYKLSAGSTLYWYLNSSSGNIVNNPLSGTGGVWTKVTYEWNVAAGDDTYGLIGVHDYFVASSSDAWLDDFIVAPPVAIPSLGIVRHESRTARLHSRF